MYYLLISDQDKQSRYNLSEGEVVIGRNADCGITLNSAAVSRKHARIYSDGPFCFLIEDLNSTNGTYVNNQKITKPAYLIHGNSITIGQASLKFVDEEYALLEYAEQNVAGTFHSKAVKHEKKPDEIITQIKQILSKVEVLNSKVPEANLANNILKQSLLSIAGDLQAIINAAGLGNLKVGENKANAVSPAEIKPPAPEKIMAQPAEKPQINQAPVQIQNNSRIDHEIYEGALADIRMVSDQVDDYKKNCYFILSVAMKIMNLNRGFIVVKDPIEGTIHQLVTKINSNEINEGMPSLLLAKYCITSNSIIVVSDPALDERFAGKSESIRSGHIKAVICAPLKKDDRTLGAIYFDSTEAPRTFTQNEHLFIEKISECVSQILIKSMVFDGLVNEYETIDNILSKVGRRTDEMEKILKYMVLEDVRSKISAIESFSKNSTAEIINILKDNLGRENNRALTITYLKIISTIGNQSEYEFIKKFLNHKDMFIKNAAAEILNKLDLKVISQNTESDKNDGGESNHHATASKNNAAAPGADKNHEAGSAPISSDMELYDDFKMAINYINKKVDSGAQLRKVINAIKSGRK